MLYSHRQIPDFQNILPGLADRKKKNQKNQLIQKSLLIILLHLAMLKQRLQGEEKSGSKKFYALFVQIRLLSYSADVS